MRIGRIHEIITTQGNECYVGSTFNTAEDCFREKDLNIKYIHYYVYKSKNTCIHELFL